MPAYERHLSLRAQTSITNSVMRRQTASEMQQQSLPNSRYEWLDLKEDGTCNRDHVDDQLSWILVFGCSRRTAK